MRSLGHLNCLLTMVILFLSLLIYILLYIIPDLYTDAVFERRIISYINGLYDKPENFRNKLIEPTYLPVKIIILEHETGLFKVRRHGKYLFIKRTIVSEEESIAQVLNHKNIVKIIKVFTTMYKEYKIMWLFMEYLNVIVDFEYINKNPEQIKIILKDVIDALYYLNRNNIAHLDVKMDNIMGQRCNGMVTYKLIDFGYAKWIENSKYYPGKSYGTFPYKPPEIVLNSLHLKESDIWCLGVLIYYMLLGEDKYIVVDKFINIDDYNIFLYMIEQDLQYFTDKRLLDLISRCTKIQFIDRIDINSLKKYSDKWFAP